MAVMQPTVISSTILWFFCLFALLHLLPTAASQMVRELTLRTAWEAEDAGLRPAEHPQCKAWNLFYRTQGPEMRNELSPEEYDALRTRRPSVSIYNQLEAERNGIPLELLHRYTVIHVHFDELCHLHPRILWINGTRDAIASHMRREHACAHYLRLHEQLQKIRSDNSTSEEIADLSQPFSFFNTSNNPFLDYLDDNGTLPEEVIFYNSNEVDRFNLSISPRYFHIHKGIGIKFDALCRQPAADYAPPDLYSKFEGQLAKLGFDATEINKIVETESNLDDLLDQFKHDNQVAEQRPFPATVLLPFLKRVDYDARSPPNFITEEGPLTVKIGIYVQTISNFQLATMDYEMDIWLRMAWRDLRLAHGLSKPILINEYTFLRKIWRPDPFFTNARQAFFHQVSYLNFYAYIFPNGNIMMEIRTMLKNSCPRFVLCKYPHDQQMCGIRISSMGFTNESIHFEWFTRKSDAVSIDSKMQLPELLLKDYQLQKCDGERKTGNYTCIEAQFSFARHVRIHIYQTYVPTTICVVFSWISVWLPEEFVEGRIFVSLTVFLTLSAENNSAKENLPKVSYVKAIDYWFGFTSTFVFLTMIQALLVITLEHNSRKLKKKADDPDTNRYESIHMLLKSRRLHRIGRNLDTLCKVMYPVVFLIFLMIYGFVITEGPENKCIRS